MKWLLKENKKYKAEWILFNISLIIFDLCSIIPPMLLGYLIDDGLKTNNQFGDMIVTVEIQLPKSLSNDEIRLYEKLQKLSTGNIRENTIHD